MQICLKISSIESRDTGHHSLKAFHVRPDRLGPYLCCICNLLWHTDAGVSMLVCMQMDLLWVLIRCRD